MKWHYLLCSNSYFQEKVLWNKAVPTILSFNLGIYVFPFFWPTLDFLYLTQIYPRNFFLIFFILTTKTFCFLFANFFYEMNFREVSLRSMKIKLILRFLQIKQKYLQIHFLWYFYIFERFFLQDVCLPKVWPISIFSHLVYLFVNSIQ